MEDVMRKLTRSELRAIDRQRRGIGAKPVAGLLEPHGVGGAAPRKRAPRRMEGADDPRYGSYRWKKLSAKVLRERTKCEGECNGFERSRYADHVIEVKDDTSDANFFDPANVQALGGQCHYRKTKREAARRAGKPEPKFGPLKCGWIRWGFAAYHDLALAVLLETSIEDTLRSGHRPPAILH
jgi:hypothetical protein